MKKTIEKINKFALVISIILFIIFLVEIDRNTKFVLLLIFSNITLLLNGHSLFLNILTMWEYLKNKNNKWIYKFILAIINAILIIFSLIVMAGSVAFI